MDKNKIIRKPDPTMARKSITYRTLEKIYAFLREQNEFVYKTSLVRGVKVDYNSVNVALAILDDKGILEYKNEKIKLKEGENAWLFD